MMTHIKDMSNVDVFIIGIFFGILITGFYIYFIMKNLKKNGYITFEPTQKLKDNFKKN